MKKENIFLDLDATLSYYDGYKGVGVLGKPIPAMMDKVRRWLKEGHKITIFTARASNMIEVVAIKKWLKNNGLPDFPVTNIKSSHASVFYDDRAVQIVKNTGQTVEEYERYSER